MNGLSMNIGDPVVLLQRGQKNRLVFLFEIVKESFQNRWI